MANQCCLQIDLSFENKDAAQAFTALLEEKQAKALKKRKALYIGSDRYLFDTDIESSENETVNIYGWVKWALSSDEAIKFISFVNQHQKLTYALIQYEETGNLIYGNYHYDGTKLWDKLIPESHTVWKNTESDNFYFDAEETLEKQTEQLVAEIFQTSKTDVNV